MQHSTVRSMEHDGLVEWSGCSKDPDDRAADRVNHESRDHPGLVIVKVEAEKELTLSRDTCSRSEGLTPESRAGQGQGTEWRTRATARRCRSARRDEDETEKTSGPPHTGACIGKITICIPST
jgi:hypothetical protein